MSPSNGVPMSQWPSPYEYVLPAGEPTPVTLTIDGREVQAKAGDLLIKVAQDNGTYIPRFCWHERMKPVGMCRMCLVEVDGMRGLQISCATVVTDGMVVHSRSDAALQAQDGVLELLLINHPLDCPVCDRGGECPLQDNTLAFGPGESRFVEEKRHWVKPIPISDLVLLDRERCIQCGRCTRFADEIAGDALISFGARGAETEVITNPDDPFTSYFSGNTVQICPVGALTATPYRFAARPWDLSAIETSCLTCAVQCRGALESTSNRLVRLLGVDSEPVNHGWLCDKGRFGYEVVHSEERVRAPMVRKNGELVECSWPEALDAAVAGLRTALDAHGPESVALLGGARGTNEDAYVWARLMKGVIGTDNVDAQLGDGVPAELALGLPEATIPDLDRAAAIVVAGIDLKEELPVLYLRVKRAADELGVPLVELGSRDQGLTRYAALSIRSVPGEQGDAARRVAGAIAGNATDDATRRLVELLEGRTGDVVVILGRGDLATSAAATVHMAAELAKIPQARFIVALRRGNVRGALELGLTPGFLPGRVTLEGGREWFEEAWGAVPTAAGLDGLGILGAARDGRLQALVLLGTDPHDDCPDRALAAAALDAVPFTIAVDAFVTDSTKRADVFLPVALWGEKAGSATNVEGRVQRIGQKISPDGTPMPDWRIASELALRLGADFDLELVEEVQDEIARVAPAFAGIDAQVVQRARDGAVVPLADHRDELVLGPLRLHVTTASWEPITPGVASEETHLSSQGAGLVASTGTGASPTIEPGMAATATPPDDPELEAVEQHVEEAVAETGAREEVRPERYRWSGPSAEITAPGRDAYALRLVTGRTLYDGGITVAASASLAPLVPERVLLVHPQDRDRIGVEDGAEVRVTSSRASVTLPVRADAAILAGTAYLPFNLGGDGVAELVDASAPVTDLRVSGGQSGDSGAERGSGHEVRTPERPGVEVRRPERPGEPESES
jgi:NADH-quinone oxidoreductase subunit G